MSQQVLVFIIFAAVVILLSLGMWRRGNKSTGYDGGDGGVPGGSHWGDSSDGGGDGGGGD